MEESRTSESKSPLTATKVYLVLYNILSLCLWCIILLQGILYFLNNGTYIGMYNEVGFLLKLTQTLQIMEIFHALLGFVNSSVFANLNQILGRNMVMWIYLHTIVMANDSTKDTVGFPLLLFGWSLSELVRYLFYICALLDVSCDSVRWCRYSFFTFLYPIGGSGEFTVIRTSLPIIQEQGLFSFSLPNVFNVSFSFYHFTLLVLAMVVPSIWSSYSHMLRQRKKVLQKQKEI